MSRRPGGGLGAVLEQAEGVLREGGDLPVEHAHQGGRPGGGALVPLPLAQRAQQVYGALVQPEGVVVIALEGLPRRLGVRLVEAEQEIRRGAEIARDGADGGGGGRRGRALGLEVFPYGRARDADGVRQSWMFTALPCGLLPFMR